MDSTSVTFRNVVVKENIKGLWGVNVVRKGPHMYTDANRCLCSFVLRAGWRCPLTR